MIFSEEPIVREVTADGVVTVKFSKNALKVYRDNTQIGTVAIPRLSVDNLRDYIYYNRNSDMIRMFVNEAQTRLVGGLLNRLYGGLVIPQAAEVPPFTPAWLYAKYVFHWISKRYEVDADEEDAAVPCYVPDEEDDFSNDPQTPTVTFERRDVQDRADAPNGQFYFLTWEGDEKCRLVTTKDLLCTQKPLVIGEIPILDIDETYQIRFLKSERRKAVRQLFADPENNAIVENLYFLHNLLLPYIFYNYDERRSFLLGNEAARLFGLGG